MTAFIAQFPYLTNTTQGVRRRIGIHAIEGDGYVCMTVCMRASVTVTVYECVRAVWYARTHVRSCVRACVRILGVCMHYCFKASNYLYTVLTPFFGTFKVIAQQWLFSALHHNATHCNTLQTHAHACTQT